MKKKQLYLFYLIVTLITWSCADDLPDNGDVDDDGNDIEFNWNDAANLSSSTLTSSFWNSGGQYFNTDNAGNTTFQYWPNAHALDVVIDGYE